MRKKAKNNLDELIAKIRGDGLYLAVYFYENKYPQLVVTNNSPEINKSTEANCFFVFPFLIPSDGLLLTPKGIVSLEIHSFYKIIRGINDGLFERSLFKLDEKIEELKRIKK